MGFLFRQDLPLRAHRHEGGQEAEGAFDIPCLEHGVNCFYALDERLPLGVPRHGDAMAEQEKKTSEDGRDNAFDATLEPHAGFRDLRLAKRLDYFPKFTSATTKRLTKTFVAESAVLAARSP